MQSRVDIMEWASKNAGSMARTILTLGGVCLLAVSAAATASDKGDKAPPAQMVDSGTFGVFMNGRRVATETFSIHQTGSGSSIVSRFKSEAGADQAEQTSDWEMTGTGDLQTYEWKEVSPGQSQAVVLASQDFLIERFRSNPQEKEQEQPFMLPASSSLLDDYFFVQREVLAWKFLASSCKQEKGELRCPLKQPVQFGALNPHARAPMSLAVEFAGKEKVTIRGVEHELNRLNLKSDSIDWTLWLDDQFKLQRILISGASTEVVRD
jgi:hypothetical protein